MSSKRIADLVLESAVDYAIITMDLQGNVTSWSNGAQNILGWAEHEMLGNSVEHIFTPDDRAQAVPEKEMSNALTKGRGTDERWHLCKDGSKFWASGEMLPLQDGGPAEGFLKILRDRTAQKHAQELQVMLNQELSHRLKNQLAMVHGIVNQSLRRADDIEEARSSIANRLGVLGRAHELLLTGYGKRAMLRAVVEKSVNLHESAGGSHFDVDGPDMEIGPRAALALSLILHELTTNAFKYGALSTDRGCVEIRWNVAALDGEPFFGLWWRELHGPPVAAPASSGFGSRLIKNGIGGATSRVDIDYAPDGLRCSIHVSMAELLAET